MRTEVTSATGSCAASMRVVPARNESPDPDRQTWWPPTAKSTEEAAGAVAGAWGRFAAPLLRSVLLDGLHQVFRSEDSPVVAVGDAGWFGPHSVTWRLHADTSMFVGGLAALLLQSLHPLAMAGVADHSDFRRDPFGRLRRTSAFVATTAYGTSEEAAQQCATVRAVHRHIVGQAPDGRRYAAADADLLDWVHVAEFGSFAAAHRRFAAAPVGRDELDRYVAEVACIAVALGDPSPPRSWAELDAALEHHRRSCAVGEQAREAWRFLSDPAIPAPAKPAYRLLFAGALASLPPWARDLWGAPAPSVAEVAGCRSLIRGIGALLGEPPGLGAAQRRATDATA